MKWLVGGSGRGQWPHRSQLEEPSPPSPPPTLHLRCSSREARGPRLPSERPMPECEQRLPHPDLDPTQRHPGQPHHRLLHRAVSQPLEWQGPQGRPLPGCENQSGGPQERGRPMPSLRTGQEVDQVISFRGERKVAIPPNPSPPIPEFRRWSQPLTLGGADIKCLEVSMRAYVGCFPP